MFSSTTTSTVLPSLTPQLLYSSLLLSTLPPPVTYTSLLLQHTLLFTLSLTLSPSAISIVIALDPFTLTKICTLLQLSPLSPFAPFYSSSGPSPDFYPTRHVHINPLALPSPNHLHFTLSPFSPFSSPFLHSSAPCSSSPSSSPFIPSSLHLSPLTAPLPSLFLFSCLAWCLLLRLLPLATLPLRDAKVLLGCIRQHRNVNDLLHVVLLHPHHP